MAVRGRIEIYHNTASQVMIYTHQVDESNYRQLLLSTKEGANRITTRRKKKEQSVWPFKCTLKTKVGRQLLVVGAIIIIIISIHRFNQAAQSGAIKCSICVEI